jgi:hypothetical protein
MGWCDDNYVDDCVDDCVDVLMMYRCVGVLAD